MREETRHWANFYYKNKDICWPSIIVKKSQNLSFKWRGKWRFQGLDPLLVPFEPGSLGPSPVFIFQPNKAAKDELVHLQKSDYQIRKVSIVAIAKITEMFGLVLTMKLSQLINDTTTHPHIRLNNMHFQRAKYSKQEVRVMLLIHKSQQTSENSPNPQLSMQIDVLQHYGSRGAGVKTLASRRYDPAT